VLFDGAFVDEEGVGDGTLGTTFGYPWQRFPLTGGQGVEGVASAAAGNQLSDNLGIKHRASACNPS